MSSTDPSASSPESAAPAAAPAVAAPAVAAPVADCGDELKRRFPGLFGGGAKPLKLKIQVDIQERAPGVFSKQQLSAFFRRYTGSTSYLIAMTRSPQRFDLDGNPAGEISEEHRKVAADELARRRANHQAKNEQVEDARRKRAALLHDFETTTLTPANFCALKGIAPQALDALLATARREAQERAQHAPPRDMQRRDMPRRDMPRRDRRPNAGKPAAR